MCRYAVSKISQQWKTCKTDFLTKNLAGLFQIIRSDYFAEKKKHAQHFFPTGSFPHIYIEEIYNLLYAAASSTIKRKEEVD